MGERQASREMDYFLTKSEGKHLKTVDKFDDLRIVVDRQRGVRSQGCSTVTTARSEPSKSDNIVQIEDRCS